MTRTTLVAAAHPDDEVLGCGGTIASLAASNEQVHVVFFTDGVSARYCEGDKGLAEATHRREESQRALQILGIQSSTHLNFPDNRLDSVPTLDVVKRLEEILKSVNPDIVFTHHPWDVNVDHRKVTEAVEIAARPLQGNSVASIFYYETLSSTEWVIRDSSSAFVPNAYVDIVDFLEVKLRALAIYKSELRDPPHPRSAYGVEIQAAWRGLAINSSAAEAFVVARQNLFSQD